MTHRVVRFPVSEEDIRKLDGVWSSLRGKAAMGHLPVDRIIREMQRANEGHFTAPPLTYSDEECKEIEKGRYPASHKPASILEQVLFWSRILPDADFSFVEKFAGQDPDVHQFAEQWGVVPKPQTLRAADYWSAYQHLVHTYFSLDEEFPVILMQWHFINNHSDRPRLTRKTAAWHERITAQTPGDFLVFPFQFGALHAGRSRRRAQVCYEHNEIGLGPYEALALLSTHPNRFAEKDALGFHCIGAKCGWHKQEELTNSAMYPDSFSPRFGYSEADQSVFLDCGLPTYQSTPSIGSITAFELPLEEVAD